MDFKPNAAPVRRPLAQEGAAAPDDGQAATTEAGVDRRIRRPKRIAGRREGTEQHQPGTHPRPLTPFQLLSPGRGVRHRALSSWQLATCYVILWFEALRHSVTLLRLGLKNWRTLAACRHRWNRELRQRETEAWRMQYGIVWAHARWIAIRFSQTCRDPRGLWRATRERSAALVRRCRQCFRLFQAFEIPWRDAPDESPQELARLFRDVRALSAPRYIKVDPLTSASAIRLHSDMMRVVFKRLLGLCLTAQEATVLARYGNPALAVREFLEYAGWPTFPSPPSALWEYLPQFVDEAARRHDSKPHSWKMARSRVGVIARWAALRHFLLQWSWRRSRAAQRRARLAVLRRAHASAARELMSRLATTAQGREATHVAVFASQMLLNALTVLVASSEAFAEYAHQRGFSLDTVIADVAEEAVLDLDRNVGTVFAFLKPQEDYHD